MPASHGWSTLHKDPDEHSLRGGGYKLRGRQHGRGDQLWLNIQLPDSSWTYLVLERGEVKEQVFARTKRECWERMRDALRDSGREAPRDLND